jgi:threonine dehydratase
MFTLAPVRPITLADIEDAQRRIGKMVVRTPLVRLDLGRGLPDIRLKLENLQPINAYKLRGAANAVAMLTESERRLGVWTISAGNAGQGVAYAARQAGVPCSVVVFETAPQSKIERMRALGAKLIPVPYDIAWKALDDRSYPGVGGTFVHPFDDHNFIAGPQVFKDWTASFVDGAGARSVFPRMWERMKMVADDAIVVSLAETRKAMRLMAEEARIISEGAGALPLAAALTGKAGAGPIIAIVSGGNVDLKKFCELIDL